MRPIKTKENLDSLKNIRRRVIKGKLIKAVGGLYYVSADNIEYKCSARKKIKQNNTLIVGDNVEFFHEKDSYFIENILTRKNVLQRPKVSNIDKIIVMIASVPKPDYLLVDKMIIYAIKLNVDLALIINKIDIANDQFVSQIKEDYGAVVSEIIEVDSLLGKGVETVRDSIRGHLCVIAGQSAVGKSTLINYIDPSLDLKVGELSKKVNRGKHTTRHSEIFIVEPGTFIIDTPGFSLLDLFEINPFKLHEYYVEFKSFRDLCKYKSCNHIQMDRKDCNVKRAVENGLISIGRYKRYIDIYNSVKDKWENTYD